MSEPSEQIELIDHGVRPVHLTAAQLTDVGAVRERNEDACLILTSELGGQALLWPFAFYLVADGMGGHYGGDEASQIASRTAADYVLDHIYRPLLNNELSAAPEQIEQIMHAAVLAAHEAVYDPDPAKNGGTTLTAALILAQQLFVAHVGDSRAYWLRDGSMTAITRDHSLVQRLLDTGQLNELEAQDYQYRNILLRALGQEDELLVDTYVHTLPRQGKLLLCSDGLCGQVTDAEMASILGRQLPPAEIAEALIAAALEAGGPDNITAVVVDFTF
jgi:protein phosphatase